MTERPHYSEDEGLQVVIDELVDAIILHNVPIAEALDKLISFIELYPKNRKLLRQIRDQEINGE